MSSKRPSSSSSAAVIEGNEDLLTEILVFLPAKPLIRLKLVSKRWKSLISFPSFCRLHTVRRRPEPQTSFLFGCERTSKYVICDFRVTKLCQFHFRLAFPKVVILQSCNGLLLLMCEEGKERRYYVFNPTTLQQRDLSPLPCASIDSIYIIFDPSSSVDYRVVCFESVKNFTVFYVYDSETHKWSDGVKLAKRVTSFRNGVCFNGGIYFVRLGSASRFDLDGSVSKIPQPPSRGTGIRNRKFAVESNGFLFCLTFSWRYGAEGVILHVSEMERGKESRWSYKNRIDMCTIVGEEEDSVDHVENVYMIRGEREEDLMLLLSARSRVVIYRFCDHSVEVVVDYPVHELKQDDPRWFVSDAHHFIETLAPV